MFTVTNIFNPTDEMEMITMKKKEEKLEEKEVKKVFVEPELVRHEEKLDEVTKGIPGGPPVGLGS
jgi:hypothetical protein